MPSRTKHWSHFILLKNKIWLNTVFHADDDENGGTDEITFMKKKDLIPHAIK